MKATRGAFVVCCAMGVAQANVYAQESGIPASAEAEQAPAEPEPHWFLEGWSSRGELGFESRGFRDDENPVTHDRALGVLARVEIGHEHGALSERLRAFGRLDHFDSRRQVLILEEGFLQLDTERLRLRLGYDILNWTTTEAFHPADVLNARNLDSEIENFEKVGELMAAAQLKLFEGTSLTLIAMPRYTELVPTSSGSRLHLAPPGFELRHGRVLIDRNGRVTDNEFGPQAAVQLRQVVGSADIALYALEHMDRSQPLIVVNPFSATPQAQLVFQTVRQVGLTYQHALGPIVAKLESAYRWFVPMGNEALLALGPFAERKRNHAAVAVGLEYGMVHDSGAESTFILEAQALLGLNERRRAELTPFQRDAMAGYRLALNDESSTEMFVGAIVDLEGRNELLYTISFQGRLGDEWTVRAGARAFVAQQRTRPTGLSLLRDADHVRLTVTRHF